MIKIKLEQKCSIKSFVSKKFDNLVKILKFLSKIANFIMRLSLGNLIQIGNEFYKFDLLIHDIYSESFQCK